MPSRVRHVEFNSTTCSGKGGSQDILSCGPEKAGGTRRLRVSHRSNCTTKRGVLARE